MPRPMVCPNTQFLGIGFGQYGSTSNRGTCLACAAAFSSMPCATPSVARTATTAAPVHNLFFFTRFPLGRPANADAKQRSTHETLARERKRAPVYLGPIPVSSVATSSKLLSRLAVVAVLLIALAPRTSAHE